VTTRPPDFDDLVGNDIPAEERTRLHRVHELLVQADQPPELSPELDAVPWPNEALAPLSPRRRGRERKRSWLGVAAVAAAIALIAFVVGEGRGGQSSSFSPVHKLAMQGTVFAPRAKATIAVGARASDGNWPMLVDVVNLAPAPPGGYYMLWLSRNGRPVAPCGSFNTSGRNETIVRLSAAYTFSGINGWIVTREVPGEKHHQVVLSTNA
jgi:anti-sigma-K factor RskA